MYGHQCDAAARRTMTGGDEHGRAWSPALLSLAGGASSSPPGVPADSRRWVQRELEITVRLGAGLRPRSGRAAASTGCSEQKCSVTAVLFGRSGAGRSRDVKPQNILVPGRSRRVRTRSAPRRRAESPDASTGIRHDHRSPYVVGCSASGPPDLWTVVLISGRDGSPAMAGRYYPEGP